MMALTMETRARLVRELRWYLIAAFVPTIALAVLAWTQGGLARFPAAVLAMLVPMIAAMLVQKRVVKKPVFKGGLLGFRKGRLLWWLITPLAAGLMVGLAFVVTFAMEPALLATGARVADNLDNLANLPDLGGSPAARLGALVVIGLLAGPLLNLPVYLGEEVGWRAFMTPRLTMLYGRRGVVLAGLIWAVWHTPLILLGHNYAEHPLIGHLVWLPLCVCLSILLQAAYRAGNSIFVAALAHGAINQATGILFAVFVTGDGFIDWLHGPAGLAGLLVAIGPALWIYLRRPDLLETAPDSAHDTRKNQQ